MLAYNYSFHFGNKLINYLFNNSFILLDYNYLAMNIKSLYYYINNSLDELSKIKDFQFLHIDLISRLTHFNNYPDIYSIFLKICRTKEKENILKYLNEIIIVIKANYLTSKPISLEEIKNV